MAVQTWKNGLIVPGLARKVYIAEEDGLYPELRCLAIYMLPEERDAADAKIRSFESQGKWSAAAEVIAKEIGKRVTRWSFEGSPAEFAKYLQPTLQVMLYRIIKGSEPNGHDPAGVDYLPEGWVQESDNVEGK